MKSFTHKSHLLSYGSALVFVVGLFSIVTAYGESHLKTQTSIGGDYPLRIQSPCPDSQPLVLSLQQSGVYVNAALLSSLPTPDVPRLLSLDGHWQNQRLDLTGTTSLPICTKTSGATAIAIQGNVVDQTLKGEIRLPSGTSLAFTAQRRSNP